MTRHLEKSKKKCRRCDYDYTTCRRHFKLNFCADCKDYYADPGAPYCIRHGPDPEWCRIHDIPHNSKEELNYKMWPEGGEWTTNHVFLCSECDSSKCTCSGGHVCHNHTQAHLEKQRRGITLDDFLK